MAKGIRRHGPGWQTYARVNGRLFTKQWPIDTPDDVLREWVRERSEKRHTVRAGTLAADAAIYLKGVLHMPTYDTRKRHIEMWVAALGADRSRHSITPDEVQAVLSRWLKHGKSPTTVRHRRAALLHLFRRLDGKGARNPVAGTDRPADPPARPRALNPDDIRRILGAIKGEKTRARLFVMATTGLPQKQIMQLTPDDVLWDRRKLLVHPRRKGKGAEGRWLPLTDAAINALKALDRAEAWGRFSTSSMRKSWLRAVKALGLPKSRPYDLRHSLGTLLYRQTGDLATVARLLGHADPRTAERYSLGAHDDLDALAMAKAGAQLPKQLPTGKKRSEKRA